MDTFFFADNQPDSGHARFLPEMLFGGQDAQPKPLPFFLFFSFCFLALAVKQNSDLRAIVLSYRHCTGNCHTAHAIPASVGCRGQALFFCFLFCFLPVLRFGKGVANIKIVSAVSGKKAVGTGKTDAVMVLVLIQDQRCVCFRFARGANSTLVLVCFSRRNRYSYVLGEGRALHNKHHHLSFLVFFVLLASGFLGGFFAKQPTIQNR